MYQITSQIRKGVCKKFRKKSGLLHTGAPLAGRVATCCDRHPPPAPLRAAILAAHSGTTDVPSVGNTALTGTTDVPSVGNTALTGTTGVSPVAHTTLPPVPRELRLLCEQLFPLAVLQLLPRAHLRKLRLPRKKPSSLDHRNTHLLPCAVNLIPVLLLELAHKPPGVNRPHLHLHKNMAAHYMRPLLSTSSGVM